MHLIALLPTVILEHITSEFQLLHCMETLDTLSMKRETFSWSVLNLLRSFLVTVFFFVDALKTWKGLVS